MGAREQRSPSDAGQRPPATHAGRASLRVGPALATHPVRRVPPALGGSLAVSVNRAAVFHTSPGAAAVPLGRPPPAGACDRRARAQAPCPLTRSTRRPYKAPQLTGPACGLGQRGRAVACFGSHSSDADGLVPPPASVTRTHEGHHAPGARATRVCKTARAQREPPAAGAPPATLWGLSPTCQATGMQAGASFSKKPGGPM